MAEAFQAHVKSGGSRAGGFGKVLGLHPGGVCEEKKLLLFFREFLETILQSVVFLTTKLELLGPFPPDEVKNVITENKPITGDFPAISEGLETRNDASPFHKWRFSIVLIELPPDHEGRLLEDVSGVGSGRDQRADKAPEVRFMTRV